MAQGHACSPCPLHAPSMARQWPANGPKELLQKAPAKGINHRPCVQNAQGFGVRWPSGLGGGGVGPCHRPPPRCNACPNPTKCFFAMFLSLHGTVVQQNWQSFGSPFCPDSLQVQQQGFFNPTGQRPQEARAVQAGRPSGLPCKRGRNKATVHWLQCCTSPQPVPAAAKGPQTHLQIPSFSQGKPLDFCKSPKFGILLAL